MDELKLLIEMVANLPTLAIWVLVGYLAYRIVIVGSIYGVLRFFIEKLFDWLKAQKQREVEYKEIRPMLDGMCVKAATDTLIAQIHRLRGRGLGIDSNYIHSQSVDWLRDAIDKKIEAERSERKAA